MLLSKYKIKHKYLFSRKKNRAGRNNTGRITVAHQGGGHKQRFRKIFTDDSFPEGTLINFEYDPNRSNFLAKMCFFKNGIKEYFYLPASKNLKILDIMQDLNSKEILKKNDKITFIKQIGNCYTLHDFNIGDFLYNLEYYPTKGAQLIRSGGTSGVLLQKSEKFATIKLPSGELRLFSLDCKAFFGNLSNDNHKNIIWRKAGKSRWLNIRPTVRGVAKNPIDHPHGGNTSGGCHPVTPWAKLTKGQPTRSKKKRNTLIIKSSKNSKIKKKV